jgi:DNA-binding CsgD family transcriptional regulator
MMYRDGVSLSEISDRYGIAYGSVFPIVAGKSFAHIAVDLITSKGDRCQRKLTRHDAGVIRKLLADGISPPKIAEMFGVKPNMISRIKTGARWPEKRAA